MMISINEEDRRFLKILLPNGQVYQFKRLPFGLNCSAAILHSTINHHLQKSDADPRIVAGMYVDDLLTGADSASEVSALQSAAIQVFREAGMNLHINVAYGENEHH